MFVRQRGMPWNAKSKVGDRIYSYNCQALDNGFLCAWVVCSMQVAIKKSNRDKRELTTAWKFWCMQKKKAHLFIILAPLTQNPLQPFSSINFFYLTVMWLWQQQQPDKRYIRARPILKYPPSGFKNSFQIHILTVSMTKSSATYCFLTLTHKIKQAQAALA